MIDVVAGNTPTAAPMKKRSLRSTGLKMSLLAKLSSDELQTLRLDEASHSDFAAVSERFHQSRAALQAFAGADIASLDGDRFDEHYAAKAEQHRSGMAVVHFLAPRILRLREGAAKRKWRSFLAKFRKDEGLN